VPASENGSVTSASTLKPVAAVAPLENAAPVIRISFPAFTVVSVPGRSPRRTLDMTIL
jgi:hypothetical protein